MTAASAGGTVYKEGKRSSNMRKVGERGGKDFISNDCSKKRPSEDVHPDPNLRRTQSPNMPFQMHRRYC
jgi:hypothetical protein